MSIIGLRAKNKRALKKTLIDAGFERMNRISHGDKVSAAKNILREWVYEDVGHPKSIRGQGNLNLLIVEEVPEALDEEIELILDYGRLKKNAKSINSDLLEKRLERRSEDFAQQMKRLYLSPEKIEDIKSNLFDGVLIESREVPDEQTEKKGSREKAEPRFELKEGDVVTFSTSAMSLHRVSYPVKVVRRTSRNAWVLPVEFETDKEFTLHPETKSYYSVVAEEELEIQTNENGEPIVDNGWGEPKRFFINKSGSWSEWGNPFGGSLCSKIKASCRQSVR